MSVRWRYPGYMRLVFLVAAACHLLSYFAAMAQAPQPGAAQPRRVVIRFLTADDYPPFNYYDEDQVLTGFNVDMARAICLEVNMTCSIEVRPWEQLLESLVKGEADAVIASHAIRPKLLATVDFTDRYYYTPARFVALKAQAKSKVSPEALEGVRIGVAKGSAHEMYLRAFFRDAEIRTYANIDAVIAALRAQQVSYAFGDGVSLSFWLQGTSSRGCCEFRGGAYWEPRFFGDGIGIAVRRDEHRLKALLNTALKRIRMSGRAEELFLRYFPIKVY